MKIILGHGRSHGFALIPVTEANNLPAPTVFIADDEARWLHRELARQLDLFDYETECKRLRGDIEKLQRANAGLRGALGRAKRVAR